MYVVSQEVLACSSSVGLEVIITACFFWARCHLYAYIHPSIPVVIVSIVVVPERFYKKGNQYNSDMISMQSGKQVRFTNDRTQISDQRGGRCSMSLFYHELGKPCVYRIRRRVAWYFKAWSIIYNHFNHSYTRELKTIEMHLGGSLVYKCTSAVLCRDPSASMHPASSSTRHSITTTALNLESPDLFEAGFWLGVHYDTICVVPWRRNVTRTYRPLRFRGKRLWRVVPCIWGHSDCWRANSELFVRNSRFPCTWGLFADTVLTESTLGGAGRRCPRVIRDSALI